jgi:hypothetical protein
MTDYSNLSDSEILARIGQAPPAPAQASPYASMSDDEIRAKLAGGAQPEAPKTDIAKAAIAMPLKGLQDSAFETVAAPFDLMAAGFRKVGIPAPEPHFYADKLKHGWYSLAEKLGGGPEMTPNTTAEKFGYGAGHGAGDAASVFLPAAALSRTAQAGGMTERIASSLAENPAMQMAAGAAGGGVGDATGNPYLGIAASLAVPAVAGLASRAVTPIRTNLSPERARQAAVLDAEGVDLSAAQRSGSRALRGVESAFESLPMTANPAADQVANQQGQFNRAVLNRAGINENSATPEVMDRAFTRLGNEFNRLSAQTTVALDPQFHQDLSGVAARYANKLPSQTREVFNNYVDDILAQPSGMNGTTYQVTRSDLTRQSRAARQGDPFFADALRGLRNALDDAAGRSVTPQNADAWNEARRQYANLKTISQAVTGGGQAGAIGDIAPAQLYSAVRASAGRDQFGRGGGELNDLARAGQSFLRNPIGNSGTAERTFWQNLMTGSLPTGGATIGALLGGLPGAAIGAGTAMVGPRLAQLAYNTGPVQAYLGNQLLQHPQMNSRIAAALLAADEKRQLTGR